MRPRSKFPNSEVTFWRKVRKFAVLTLLLALALGGWVRGVLRFPCIGVEGLRREVNTGMYTTGGGSEAKGEREMAEYRCKPQSRSPPTGIVDGRARSCPTTACIAAHLSAASQREWMSSARCDAPNRPSHLGGRRSSSSIPSPKLNA
ncbi:hypothetical protein B0H19DRAFT_535569 [Mycena capillaripes]|nr:hypothetical protein B0H19DRAFT_535569 [Mycena capillaripes]